MARMAGVPEEKTGLFGRLFFWAVRRRMGRVMESWSIAAHAPPVLRGWAAFEWFLERSTSVEPKLKRLAQLKVSVIVGCPG